MARNEPPRHAMQYPQPTTAGLYGSLRRPATRQYRQRCDALPGEMCEHRMMAPAATDHPESEGGVNRMSMTHSLNNAMMPPPMPSLMLPPLHPTTTTHAAPPVGILRNRCVPSFTGFHIFRVVNRIKADTAADSLNKFESASSSLSCSASRDSPASSIVHSPSISSSTSGPMMAMSMSGTLPHPTTHYNPNQVFSSSTQ